MHTYNKNGYRKAKLTNDIKVKKGVKQFYTKIKQIEDIALYLKTLEEPVTEENIDSVVPELIGRELDSMEKMLILSKLNNESQNNT